MTRLTTYSALTFASLLLLIIDATAAADIRSFVDEFIASHPVAMFSKSYCPYCKRAKQALNSFEFRPDAFGVIELDHRSDGEEILDYLREKTGARYAAKLGW